MSESNSQHAKTVQKGELVVGIDNWGGLHFHHGETDGGPTDGVLSLDPDFVRRIMETRQEVMEDDSE